jgi:large exoprotein involved in heme utilization and adhesion
MRGNAGLWLADSAIETSVHGAGGDGGDIFVQAPALFLETGAIRANAISGHGGDIRLDVQNLAASGNRLNQREIGSGDPFAPELGRMAWKPYRFGDNVIQAVSYRGVNGTISLLAPQLNLSSVISNLGTPRFGEKLLTSDYCDVDNRSSLVLMGRGAPPRRSRDLQWLGD